MSSLLLQVISPMDASAYLSKRGWRGTGHSLDSTDQGLKNPLLTSKKNNQLGIGNKKHAALSDQWWARAFDSSLKDLNVGSNAEAAQGAGGNTITTSTTEIKTTGLSALKWARWTGKGDLYSGFVKGKTLGGTLTPETVQADTETLQTGNEAVKEAVSLEQPWKETKKKRKRASDDLGGGEDANESRSERVPDDAAPKLEELSTLKVRKAKQRTRSKERRHQLRRNARLAKAAAPNER